MDRFEESEGGNFAIDVWNENEIEKMNAENEMNKMRIFKVIAAEKKGWIWEVIKD